MGKAMGETYSNAGILKKAGRGLVLNIAGAEFFLVEEDLNALMGNQMADVVNCVGEEQGLAWLSPLLSDRKMDLTTVIDCHIYSITYRGFWRVAGGDQRYAVIREFRPCRPA
jgi:hypothetical protein